MFLSGSVIASRTAHPAPARQDRYVLYATAFAAFDSEALLSSRAVGSAAADRRGHVGIGLHALVPIVFGMFAGLIVFSVASLSIHPLFWSGEKPSPDR